MYENIQRKTELRAESQFNNLSLIAIFDYYLFQICLLLAKIVNT